MLLLLRHVRPVTTMMASQVLLTVHLLLVLAVLKELLAALVEQVEVILVAAVALAVMVVQREQAAALLALDGAALVVILVMVVQVLPLLAGITRDLLVLAVVVVVADQVQVPVVDTVETLVFLGKAQMEPGGLRRVALPQVVRVVVVGRALVFLLAKAQSELFGPVVQEHSPQHERQMSNKYESLY
jgi:hypothetical protein